MMGDLLELAPELVVHILAHLDLRDLLQCSEVCRELKDIIEDSLLLRYAMERATYGMADGVPGPSTRSLTISDHYTRLLVYDATWRSLGWRKQEALYMRDSTAIWELYGGVLGTGSPTEGSREHWRLEFRELNSSGRRGTELEVSHWGFEVELPLVEMAMDPVQDLLVLLSVPEAPIRTLSIHLRTLSSNAPHPASRGLGVLSYLPPSNRSQNLFDRRLGPWVVTQICGPLLGLMVFSEGVPGEEDENDNGAPNAHLVIWDWTTGQRVADINGLKGLVTFSFLSPRYLLLSRLGNAEQSSPPLSPDDYDYSSSFGSSGPGNPHQPSLDIYDLHLFKPNTTQHETSFVRRYLLPNVKPSARVQMVRVFSELSTPLPHRPPGPGASEGKNQWGGELSSTNKNTWVGTGAPAPFTIAPHSRIFVVRIVLVQQRRGATHVNANWQRQATEEFALVMPLSTLLPCADSTPEADWALDRYVPLGAPPALLVKTIAWRDWGPSGTRMLPLEHPQDFFDVDRSFYPYGPRVAIPLRCSSPNDSGKFRLRVLNVNQLAVRHFTHMRRGRKTEVANGTHSVVRAVLAPSTVSRNASFFERDVTTCLPYLETCTGEDVSFESDCFMLTEDNLFTVKAEDSYYSVQIYTF